MDYIFAGIIIKGAIAAFIVVGAITALFIGRGLYKTGVGLKADDTKVEYKEIKASLKTVGSVVMATSVAWAFLGWKASPNIKDNSIEITSYRRLHVITDDTRCLAFGTHRAGIGVGERDLLVGSNRYGQADEIRWIGPDLLAPFVQQVGIQVIAPGDASHRLARLVAGSHNPGLELG